MFFLSILIPVAFLSILIVVAVVCVWYVVADMLESGDDQ